MPKTLAAPQVSIIVPVYNVEAYLRRSLNSILAQTMPDWECICVDDGSPDACGAILDEYAAKDARFVVIHKENGGTSTARNAGLDAARGEYIGFVDPDDWIEPDTYEAALKAARDSGADLVQWNYAVERGDASIPQKKRQANEKREGFFNVAQDYKEYFTGAVYNKLFRSSLLRENQIRFPVGMIKAQDVAFCIMAYAFLKKSFYINRVLYHYDTTRETSICNNVTEDILLNMSSGLKKAFEFIEERDKELCAEWGDAFLHMKVFYAKYPFISLYNNFRLFRSVFPEANRQMLRYFLAMRTRSAFVMLLAAWRLDLPARALVWAWKRFLAK